MSLSKLIFLKRNVCMIIAISTIITLNSCGSNNPDSNSSPPPYEFIDLAQIALGYDHTCALSINGYVKCWGGNSYGQLGNGTSGYRTSKSTPAPVSNLTSVTQIALGNSHTCALINDGTVKCWGYNFSGQLGDGTSGYGGANFNDEDRNVPTAVSNLTNVTQISLRSAHACALINDGTVKCWGYNSSGQLGDGTSGLDDDDADYNDENRNVPTAVSNLTNVTQIAVGGEHTCALLGDNPLTSDINEEGTVKCWGSNRYGQLGVGTNGTNANKDTPTIVPNLTNVTQISLGNVHTCVLLGDNLLTSDINEEGTVKCWGYNYYGQLGDGTSGSDANKNTPTVVPDLTNVSKVFLGDFNTCALFSDGAVKCWGGNDNGQLGDGTNANKNTPTIVPNLTNVTQISLGNDHVCALLIDDAVKCWGGNYDGQLGDGTSGREASKSTPTIAPDLTNVSQISLGGNHTCALLGDNTLTSDINEEGTVKCWGYNSDGQLGDGTSGSNASKSTPVSVSGLSNVHQISLGYDHTCALLDNSTVKCWGANDDGQLGDGTRGTNAGKIAPTIVSNLTNVSQISLGSDHTCALLGDNPLTSDINEEGTVKCWGDNYYGQLGDGTSGSNARKNTPTVVPDLTNVTQIVVGFNHTCALLDNSAVKCWGSNSSGQLGDGTSGTNASKSTPTAVSNLTNVTQIAVGGTVKHGEYSCALLVDSTVKCWGANYEGQLGDSTIDYEASKSTPTVVLNLTNVTQISLGSNHTCALINDGTVKCWGANYDGQLGDGSTSYYGENKTTAVSGLSNVSKITLGYSYTCALINDGTVKCWGDNYYGQLGDGTSYYDANKNVPTLVIGLFEHSDSD